MAARELFKLLLRVLAFWMLIRGLAGGAVTAANVAVLFADSPAAHVTDDGVSLPRLALWWCLQPGVECALAACLLFGAPRLADRFYPATDSSDQRVLNIHAPDLYRIASRLLGIYAVLWAIRPVVRVIVALAGGDRQHPSSERAWVPLCEAVLYLGVALILLFGARRIAAACSRLHRAASEFGLSGKQGGDSAEP